MEVNIRSEVKVGITVTIKLSTEPRLWAICSNKLTTGNQKTKDSNRQTMSLRGCKGKIWNLGILLPRHFFNLEGQFHANICDIFRILENIFEILIFFLLPALAAAIDEQEGL